MSEGYSREAFEENERKIDDARELARLKPFGARPTGINADPGDIMDARFQYLGAKNERERLKEQAQKEAIQEDAARSKSVKPQSSSQEKENPFITVKEYSAITLETES